MKKIVTEVIPLNFWKYSTPKTVFPIAGKVIPMAFLFAVILCVAGIYVGFFVAPTDFQQGEVYRIIFIHVPSAWMSMFIYIIIVFWSLMGLIFNTRLSFMMAQSLAPTGAVMTLIALWTGALWGKPTWGTWWVWDARLTSELILLFLYIGYIVLGASIDDIRRSDRTSAILALIGAVNIPIIYFSVEWWSTLHQGASISLTAAPKMAASMFLGLCLMSLSFWMYTIGAAFYRLRIVILKREKSSTWLREFEGAP